MSLSVQTKEQLSHLNLSGAVNFQNVAALEEHGQKAMLTTDALTINMTKATAEDSSILALLLSWQRFAAHNKKTITFINANSKIRAMAQVGGIEHLLWKN